MFKDFKFVIMNACSCRSCVRKCVLIGLNEVLIGLDLSEMTRIYCFACKRAFILYIND